MNSTNSLEPSSASTPVSLMPRRAVSVSELEDLNQCLEPASPAEIVAWAADRFGSRLALTASFADTLLIDIAVGVEPDIEVVFLDTGFHFPETLETVRAAMARYALRLTVLRPDGGAHDLWADGTEACCEARKTETLARYLRSTADAWLSGMRRSDDPSRASTPIVGLDRNGLVKVNPLAAMTDAGAKRYISSNAVIVNSLAAQGYASIGCWPCTEPSNAGRGGRWAGTAKTECGLHS